MFSFLTLLSLSSNGQTPEVTDYITELEQYRNEHEAGLYNTDRSPLEKEDLKDLRYFDTNQEWIVSCVFTETPQTEVFQMNTYSGMLKPYRKYGTLQFEVKGNSYELALYQSQKSLSHPIYKHYLFLPFKDLTNSDTSYGGGRYIDVKISEIESGHFKLDFNKAYNPWCAYSAGYNCPIPPAENHLNMAITAGESIFAGSYKKE